MSEIEIRPMRRDDLPAVLDVLRASLGETPLLRRTPEQWSWKHDLNPFGPSITLVAVSGDRIAGVRALMRWQLSTPQGGSISCVRPVDTATHPDFARRGIFRNLTQAALDVARSAGIQLVFNTPNERSGAGYLSMGWQEVGAIGVLARIRLGPAVKVKEGQAPLLSELAPTCLPFRPVSGSERPPRGLRTVRDERYQDWRFGAHPTARFGLVRDDRGAAVIRANVRSGRSEVVLSDLLAGAGRKAVRQAARSSRARYMAGFFSPGSPERAEAIAAGMLPIPGVLPLRLFALPLADLETDVFDLGSWDLATSDLELL